MSGSFSNADMEFNAQSAQMEDWKRKQQAHGCRVAVYGFLVFVFLIAACVGIYMFGMPDLSRLDFYQWMVQRPTNFMTGELATSGSNAAMVCVGAGALGLIGVFTGLALLLHFTPDDWVSESGNDGHLI